MNFKRRMVGCIATFGITLLCLLSVSGCTTNEAVSNGLLNSIPEDAQLVYTYTANAVYGENITTDPWNHTEDTGFFVAEFLCESGSIQQAELRQGAGKTVTSFETIEEDGIYITDIVVDAADDYALYFDKADYFVGEINVYFVSGIGYYTAD